MLRLWLFALAVCMGGLQVKSADPGQIIQGIFCSFQQLGQKKQRRQRHRRQYVRQLIKECRQQVERACQDIIDARGMPPLANYVAFACEPACNFDPFEGVIGVQF